MELPKIGSKFFASRTSKYLGWFIMTLQEYAGGSTMIEKDHPRKIWVGSDCHSMGTSSHTIVIMSSPDRHSPRGVFQTLGDFSSPVTPGNTANLGNGPLGHSMHLHLGMAEFHPFLWSDWGRFTVDDLLVLHHQARTVWKLWAPLVSFLLLAPLRGKKYLCHKRYWKRNNVPQLANPFGELAFSRRKSVNIGYPSSMIIWLYHIIPSPGWNSTETVASGVALRRCDAKKLALGAFDDGPVLGAWRLAVDSCPAKVGNKAKSKATRRYTYTY